VPGRRDPGPQPGPKVYVSGWSTRGDSRLFKLLFEGDLFFLEFHYFFTILQFRQMGCMSMIFHGMLHKSTQNSFIGSTVQVAQPSVNSNLADSTSPPTPLNGSFCHQAKKP